MDLIGQLGEEIGLSRFFSQMGISMGYYALTIMLKFDVKIPTRRSKNFFLGFEGRNFNNFFRILRTLGFFSYLVKSSHFVSPTAWYSHFLSKNTKFNVKKDWSKIKYIS